MQVCMSSSLCVRCSGQLYLFLLNHSCDFDGDQPYLRLPAPVWHTVWFSHAFNKHCAVAHTYALCSRLPCSLCTSTLQQPSSLLAIFVVIPMLWATEIRNVEDAPTQLPGHLDVHTAR